MKLRRIPRDTAALDSTLPLLLPGGREGALLIHGFTGSPMEVAGLAQRLHAAGLTVSVPRLPGHGTRGDDFLQTGSRDWLRAAVDAWADMKGRCDTVHLIGHSMGGILAVLLASHFPVGRLVLVAPALRASNPLLAITPILGLFVRKVRWPVTTTRSVTNPDTAVLAREYWAWRFPGRLRSFLRLQRMAVRALRGVKADTLVVVGGKDQTVPASVADFVERRIGSRTVRRVVLPQATHQTLAGAEGAPGVDAIVGFLTSRGATDTVRA